MLEASSAEAYRDALNRFAQQLGFNLFSSTTVIDHLGHEPEFISVGNMPESFKASHEDRALHKRDPVLQHCKLSSLPIIWDRSTYAQADRLEKWEFQEAFGLCCGIALATHLPGGRHFIIGVERDQPLPERAADRERLVAELHYFSVFAQDSALRLFLPAATDGSPALTTREAECLRWTVEGKTAWEVGRILGIVENTAIRHLHSASQKLGTTSKHQAALKALRLGILG